MSLEQSLTTFARNNVARIVLLLQILMKRVQLYRYWSQPDRVARVTRNMKSKMIEAKHVASKNRLVISSPVNLNPSRFSPKLASVSICCPLFLNVRHYDFGGRFHRKHHHLRQLDCTLEGTPVRPFGSTIFTNHDPSSLTQASPNLAFF